jgi:D-amino-acid dehydrogenase
MKIIIIGGGIIGYNAAWFLNNSGHEVTILEKNVDNSSASYGNAGMVVPSHFIPLASPGIISKGIKWMFQSDSPFYIRPRFDFNLFRWIWQFFRHSTLSHVNDSIELLRDLNLRSRDLYKEIIPALGEDVFFKPDGLLMIYNTAKGEKEETKTAKIAERLGIATEVLDSSKLSMLEKGIEYKALGAVYYPGDAFMDPGLYMFALERKLRERGVEIIKGVDAARILTHREKIGEIETEAGVHTADHFILSAGIHSNILAAQLGINLPMQGGKGYSITLESPEQSPNICSILTEAKVAITPMGPNLRFAGTMEIAGNNLSINRKRVSGYLKAVTSYLPGYDFESLKRQKVWAGLRPCSPDGLPYIGRSHKYDNLVIATGHAMLGHSLGPVTGELVSQIVEEKEPGIKIDKLSPDRYQ